MSEIIRLREKSDLLKKVMGSNPSPILLAERNSLYSRRCNLLRENSKNLIEKNRQLVENGKIASFFC